MPDKIQVDLVANLRLLLDKLGMGKDIDAVFKSHKSVVLGIAKELGLDFQKAMADGLTKGTSDGILKGIKDGIKRASGEVDVGMIGRSYKAMTTPLDFQALTEKREKVLADRQKIDDRERIAGLVREREKLSAIKPPAGYIETGMRGAAYKAMTTPFDFQRYSESLRAQEAKMAAHPPPVIPHAPSNIFAKIEQMMTGKGGLLGGFGRYEVGNAFAHSLGMGGGIGGRLAGAGLAGFGGKIPGLAVGLAALTGAIEATKVALQHLMKAAEDGAKLYIQSRQLGVSPVTTSSFLKTLGAVGIDEQQALRLASLGEFGRGKGSIRGNVAGQILASGRATGMTPLELQQIANMSKEINEAWQQTRAAAIESANSAKANFSIVMELDILKVKISTTMQELSGLLEPIVYGLSRTIGVVFDDLNAKLLLVTKVLQYAGIIPKENGDPHKIAGFSRATHFGSLERMGLVIGGGADRSQDYLREIAKNTAIIASKSGGGSGPGLWTRAAAGAIGPRGMEALVDAITGLSGRNLP